MEKIKNNKRRSFIVGGEWLYFKLYTGTKTSDLILTDIIKPATEYLLKKKLIDQWFFIRFADPKHHIRFRLHCTDTKHLSSIIDYLHPLLQGYIDSDLIWKVQMDTYHRELERYGADTIEAAEELFFYDSKMIVDLLDLIGGVDSEELRWLFGIRAIDKMLDDFNYAEEQKMKLLERIKISFAKEFKANKFLKKQLDKKFRKEQSKIKDFLKFDRASKPDFEPLLELLETKSDSLKPVIKIILEYTENRNRENIIGSYIHMLMNRLFRSKNRLHELVIYDLLFKYYRAEVGRKKYKPKHTTHQLA